MVLRSSLHQINGLDGTGTRPIPAERYGARLIRCVVETQHRTAIGARLDVTLSATGDEFEGTASFFADDGGGLCCWVSATSFFWAA